ncbi:MAG: bifunctional ADP-dependent NAD(P)H-hydrate dehydratase/NAD(P)H-hydrate epimerase [Roseovarius sp.]|nr:bifunctional ADP-dependent NAD(P)H-hydrate dehydratase/NAD(P)H-hydrate epimerase [Roseovarius sp.]
MTDLITAARMRAQERAAIESGVVTGLELMERAGRGVVAAILARWPDLASGPQRAQVLCGPGNNGGDGFVIARLLAARGWTVTAYLLGDPARLPPDARANLDRWQAVGAVVPLAQALPDERSALLVDALFGTGLTRPLEGAARAACDRRAARIVSVDLPSGLCGDSGRVLGGAAMRADLTVSFHAARPGHYLAEGPAHCGALVLADIGLDHGPGDATLVAAPDAARLAKGAGHKYTHGHALVLTGGAGHTGAARLAARAALRVGAGAVTLGVPGAARLEVACHITAEMLRPVAGAADLRAALADPRITALCLGPGLGLARAREMVPEALRHERAPCIVLDADALTAFADAPDELFGDLHETCVLTPHAGEFARLFPDLAAELAAPATRGPAFSRLDATRAAARRAGCVVLFKGPDTVIAAPDGRCSLHAACYDRAAPWLATAGSGDVLAGMITGLLARGMGPMEAAGAAAWLHAEAARAFGPGLIATDLAKELPGVLRAL